MDVSEVTIKRLLFGSLVVFSFLYGVTVGRYKVFPYQLVKETKHLVTARTSARSVDPGYSAVSEQPEIPSVDEGYSDVSEKREIPCHSIDMTTTMVALTFGQSNSANEGATRYSPRAHVYNFYQGKCYKATDPLLGATGEKGSVWTRLGEMLVDNGLYSNVIFVSIGVRGTPVSRWKTDGDLFQRIVKIKSQLDQNNITLTDLFWHQGEMDAKIGTKKDDYKTMLTDMIDGIRRLGIDAPLYVAIATRCRGPINVDIHQAQLELVAERDDILMGSDTDTISDMDDRYDFCHFSDSGLHKHALLWLQAIQNGDSAKYAR
jgi:hypothetical protein